MGNFQTIKSLVSAVLPFSHYFDNGIIGTGTCIFSNKRINEVTFHEFGLNGYPHKITHGDWFGGKGLGVCQVIFAGIVPCVLGRAFYKKKRKNIGNS